MRTAEYILTGEEMQSYDKNTIEYFGVPSIILMEQAALSALDAIRKRTVLQYKKVLVLAGNGNNGGDALALGRLLTEQNANVTIFFVNNEFLNEEKFTKDTCLQYHILKKMKIQIVTELPSDSYDMIIDGIFGVGLNRDITGSLYELIHKINQYKGIKYALDIPSGIHSETGQVQNIAFKADFTITFAFYKRGHFFYPGRSYCGEVIKKEIGITEKSFLDQEPRMKAFGGEVSSLLPKRAENGHKGTFGKVLIVAGNKEVGGAALLSAKAALMSGCGMVRICTHKEQYEAIFSHLPEAIYDCYTTKEEAVTGVKKGLLWADVIVMGPGMGTNDISKILWKEVIYGPKKPLILDADALNLLSLDEFEVILKQKQNTEEERRNLILTPHPLEFSRLCNKTIADIKYRWEDILKEYANRMKAIVVKKDAPTVICDDKGTLILNCSGNNALATAGSGDVLCGIIASFISYNCDLFSAVCIAVYCHGKLGEFASLKKGCYSVIAGDLLEALPDVLRENKME